MKKWTRWAAIAAMAFAIAGCASGVKREGDYAAIPGKAIPAIPVSDVTLTMSPNAARAWADNPKFSKDQMLATVRRTLEAKGLLQASAPEKAEIVVNDFRVRGTFSAVMWGAMAGTDNVTGDVIVRNPAGGTVRKFAVNASYGLGGIAGGMDDTRLNWLYEKFAEHTGNELSGKKD